MVNYDDVLGTLRRLPETTRAWVSLVTNQAGGAGSETPTTIASYASGPLSHDPAGRDQPAGLGRLFTSPGEPLTYLFSNRALLNQPFNGGAADRLGLEISRRDFPGRLKATFTMHTWEDMRFEVPLEEKADVLVGIGPAVGNSVQVTEAIYVISFSVVKVLR